MSDPLVQGQQITDKQRQDLADSNRKETEEAQRLAAEHRASDERNGIPTERAIAESIKEKLENLPPEEPQV